MKSIKDLRKEKGITQEEASRLCSMSLRSYKMYENEYKDKKSIKRDYIIDTLNKYGFIDETHGVLSLDEIKNKVSKVLKKYDVTYCVLFGSYAKGKAKDKSDIDLLIKTSVTGLDYFGLVEDLRNALHKEIDLLNTNQLKNNLELTEEILKDGIRIYG